MSLKSLIKSHVDDGKVFYSLEITPKKDVTVNFSEFVKLPLFVNLTWIKDDNLKVTLTDSSTIQIGSAISSTEVVHSITCFNLTEQKLDEFLNHKSVVNLNVLRGDVVDEHQKYKHANELIEAIKGKMIKEMTIFGAGYPDKHPESTSFDEDLLNLKNKVDAGVDVILTQVIFSAEKFVEFVRNCRKVGIQVPILPGLYIPHNYKELKRIINLTKIQMPEDIYQHFKSRRENDEEFKNYSINWMMTVIKDIKQKSPEFISGYHFFTMNNFEMIQKCIQLIDFQ
ncbi:unnamed protein product [Diamesa serratosioi]